MNREPWDLDLGDDHGLLWLVLDGRRTGAIIEHKAAGGDSQPAGEYCAGGIQWGEPHRPGPTWTLEGEADEHITLSPSVLCSCGDHGFIRDGKWVRA